MTVFEGGCHLDICCYSLSLPQGEGMATKGAATIKDPHFLATCFKHLKQKPEVEFTAVAAELDMSVGGAQ